MNPNVYLCKAKLLSPSGRLWARGFYCSRQETTYVFKEDYERNPVKTHHYIAVDSMTDWGLPNELRLHEVNPETLCRCTGMKDKNGKLIWENDIVSIGSELFICHWDTCNFEWSFCGKDESFGIAYRSSDDVEVVGNTFDNAELLVSKLLEEKQDDSRTETIKDFKRFLSANREILQDITIDIKCLPADDEWLQDDEWDEMYKQEVSVREAIRDYMKAIFHGMPVTVDVTDNRLEEK